MQTWHNGCDEKEWNKELWGDGEGNGDWAGDGDSPFGDSEKNEVGKSEVDFSNLASEVLDENLFSINASCPPPEQFAIFGSSFSLSWEPVCDLASYVRPLVIAMGYVAAIFIMIRRIRE